MATEITLVSAVDKRHLPTLMACLPTWRIVKGIDWPILIFANGWRTRRALKCLAADTKQPNVRFVNWDMPEAETQRERMLTSFVLGVAKHVETPWHLKLDSKTLAVQPGPWFEESWFTDFDMVASPWGYTKPPHWPEKIDYWLGGLADAGRIPVKPGSDKWKTKPDKNEKGEYDWQYRPYVQRKYDGRESRHRICSWLKFMRTSIARDIAGHCAFGRMPVPSEDSLCWRYAEQLGMRINRFKFARVGWLHSKRHYRKLAEEAILNAGSCSTATWPTTSERST